MLLDSRSATEGIVTQFRVVDLFSGCGGLSCGFERAGFKIAAAFDSWNPAIETYAANFDHAVALSDLDAASLLPEADVIVGS